MACNVAFLSVKKEKNCTQVCRTIDRDFPEGVQRLHARSLKWRGELWCFLECRKNPSPVAAIAELRRVLLGALWEQETCGWSEGLRNRRNVVSFESIECCESSTIRGVRNSETTSSESTKHIHQHVQTHIVLCSSCIQKDVNRVVASE